MADKPLAIALMGPTAAGKTDLAIALHQRLGADIISVDSALIYRGMDIGTAKPSAKELALAPHRLINILDPAEAYSAADFSRDAAVEMERIVAAGRTPLLVGGTMLYFKAFLHGLSPIPASDLVIRAQIEAEAERYGWPHLHQQLQQVDPEIASRLHPNHSQRISRALEVFRGTGKPLSDWQRLPGCGAWSKYHWVQIAIAPQERNILHQRIAQRFDLMLQNGFIDEVKQLYQRQDLHAGLPSIRAVGYRQLWHYLDGQCDYEQMRAEGVAATRQLAKRQLTWLRGWHDLSWVNTLDSSGYLLSFHEILTQALNIIDKRAI